MDTSNREIYQVVIEHQASYSYSLELKAGERVTISDKKENGWVWCINKKGTGAWVPEKYLERKEHTGITLFDYSSAELTVIIGERLTFIKEESGWIWCTNQKGQNGWVPLYKAKKL